MAKKSTNDEGAGKSKKRATTPSVKRVTKPTPGSSTASQKPEERKPAKTLSNGFIVRGDVSLGGKPFPGVLVHAVDMDQGGENLLGETPTDEQGHYEIQYTEQQFRHSKSEKGGADLIVHILDTGGEIIASSRKINNAQREEIINVVVKKESVATIKRFVVSGQVRQSDDSLLAGALVRAFGKDMRSDYPLGKSATTDKEGRYKIVYTSRDFSSPESGSVNLIVRASTQDDRNPATSPVIYNAKPEETVDLIISGNAVGPSEYTRLITELTFVLRGVQLHGLTEADIDFLVGNTGQDRQHIVWLAQAANLAHEVKSPQEMEHAIPAKAIMPALEVRSIPVEAFYGWFRQGLPIELDALITLSDNVLKETLEASLRDNFIPDTVRDSVDSVVAAWARFKAARMLRPAPIGDVASLGDVLNTMPEAEQLPLDHQLVFAHLHQTHGNSDALWEAATDMPELARAIPGLKRTLGLAELTQEHPALISALQEKRDTAQPDSLKYLATIEPTDWIELVFEHGVAVGSGLDRDAYIEKLQIDVERKFPTQILTKQLEDKVSERESFPTGKVVDFLKANPDLDLRTKHVEPYLKETGNPDDHLREGLLQLQRIHAVTSNARETSVLLDAGFASSTQIINEGKPAFKMKMAGQLSEERAGEVFAAAENVVTTVTAIATAYALPSTSGNAVAVIPAPKVISDEALSSYPSLRTLFGDLDYCECPHCQSVLGPAAYLADLMHFLQRSPLTPNPDGHLSPANLDNKDLEPLLEYAKYAVYGTVLGALLQRRPDLADLELSCENTDTKIPYIDLVLEILENAVALPMGIVVEGINIDAEFAAGKVPAKVAEELHKTAIEVGKELHVTHDLHQAANSLLQNWIISDRSRRWLVQHRKPHFIFSIRDAPVPGWLQVLDVEGAVDSLLHGKFNAELETNLAQQLSIEGPPKIQGISIPGTQTNASWSALFRGWTAEYTRSIAIKIKMGSSMGVVELLKFDGTQFKPPRQWQWPLGTMQIISHAFTSGITSKINPNVAQLLGLSANETYQQIWNPAKNWWELRINNTAMFMQILEGLNVSGLTYQNSSIHDHLEANPENRNPEAYEKLKKDAVFPWALPFDSWLEETRAFLEALGIPRANLVDLARPQSRLSEDAAALELLSLSKSEADLIAPATVSKEPWIYWGLAEKSNIVADHTAGSGWKGSWLEVLAHLSMLLQQSSLSYREYLDLLQTSFVRQPKLMLLPPNECKTSNIILAGLNEMEFTDHLNRIHIFTRLWRKLGWSMRELDLALAAFGGQLTLTTLQDLAHLKRLNAELGLPISVLVACIDKLETQAWTSHTKDGTPLESAFYDNVFQRKSVRSLTGFDDFAIEKLGNSPPSISDRADFVAASLGIKPDQVKAWISGTRNLGITDPAILDNLSRLYAAASLCRAFQIAPDTLSDIVALSGVGAGLFQTLPAPTSSAERAQQARARTLALIEFTQRCGFVQASGFDFETLSYLLRHKTLPGKRIDASTRVEQQLTQTLTELRTALQSGVVLGDLSADNVKRQLARLGWYPALIDAATGSDGLNYQPGVSVEITPLPLLVPVIPLNLRSKFIYQELDSSSAELKCIGSLSDSDFTVIENLIGSGWGIALKTKYNQGLKDRSLSLADFLQVIELKKLPELDEVVNGVTLLPVIPGELADRLKFELSSPTAGKLSLKGWLTTSDLQALSDASPSNSVLSTPLSNLQSRALNEIPAPSSATLVDAELMLREPDGAKRSRAILIRLVPHLDQDLIVTLLSETLGSDQKIVGRLLDAAKVNARSAIEILTESKFLSLDPYILVDRKALPDQFAALELLGKIATIANRLSVMPEELDWLLGGVFTVIDVLTLPTTITTAEIAAANFDGWRKLVDLFHLRDVVPDGAKKLAHVYQALKAHKHHYEALVRAVFARAFGLGPHMADGVCNGGLLSFNAVRVRSDYNNPSRLLEMAQLLHVSKLLSAPCSEIERLIQLAPDHSVAQVARTLFAASIDANEFPERLRPISDRLRNLQRDALVAYLIHRDHLTDSNELFDRYLIDVEMGPCMLTSRIKQAISSIQLFVQRCLLNLEQPTTLLEPGVSPESIDTQLWQWMKFYRIWEANRKIFLYPENWIEPELRDDKTEIFQSFESDLLQSEITHDTALVAFRKYLDNLGDVANLTVVSMFEEQTGDGGTIVHLVGRDNSQPYKHYYRQWKLRPDGDFGTWTAWEEVSIQADSDHIMVFMFGGSVYLAWPSISGQGSGQHWQVRMNLCKRTASGWSKLKKGRGDIVHPMVPNKDERTGFVFRLALEVPQSMLIRCYGISKPEGQVGETLRNEAFTLGYLNSSGPPFNIYISFDIRTLARFTDASGKVFYYLVNDLACKYEITFIYQHWNNAESGPRGSEISETIEFDFPNSAFTDTIPLLAKIKSVWSETDAAGHRNYYLNRIASVAVKASAPSGKYVNPTFFSTKPLDKNDANWVIDIAFDLQPGQTPDTYSEAALSLEHLNSFKLTDDDGFELFSETLPGSAIPKALPNTEHFMSGYRELKGPLDELSLGSNLQALTKTRGQYFTVPAQVFSNPIREIWSYRDDEVSLLFWRNQLDLKFRVVPFSTGGMHDLKTDVTKGRLLAAVALPGSLTPKPLDVGTDIDCVCDPVTRLGTKYSNSVTQVEIDFEKVPSSIYNWEVFFHNLLLVATQLSQAQRFEEAQRWFHLIFDPTTNDPDPAPTQGALLDKSIRYWRFLPFRTDHGRSIDELLKDLAQGKISMHKEINEWAENPFRPHLVARQRLRSYKFAVVQKYVENLVAWGDQLFRRDTIESINEATQLYVLADKILGKRPASSPKQSVNSKSYRDIHHKLDDFTNAWIPLEGPIATALSAYISNTGISQGPAKKIDDNLSGILNNFGGLYFCIPANEKLSEYWDTVEDRLFKIRHCMNIEGIERQLPLFEPPIDPALLVRATAAGLDLAAVLSGLDAPLPFYRFNIMLQKALELCGEVRALGNALLSALEKKDAEQLSLLRSSHEIKMLKLVRVIKEQQQIEAEANIEALRKTREVTAQRYLNYQRLMGKREVVAPAEGTVATPESSTLQLMPPNAGDTDSEGLALISAESGQMGWLNDANNFSLVAGSHAVLASVFHIIPDFAVGITFPVTAETRWGGSNLGSAVSAAGAAWGMAATNASFQASRSGTIGSHQRRQDEWRFQSNIAAKELEQIDRQILANEIRIKIAEQEIANHDQQIENAQAVNEYMRDKFTNQQLYSWMVGQISSVYFRTYQLAHDIAKRAERTYRFELGLKDNDSSFIEFGYWDSLKKGLLSGERLYLDLKRMEAAYLDKNKREYEIAKHVSLMQLNPMALLRLKEIGQCEVNLSEALLDMDFPGHYLRRIKSVSLTIPCVTGPYSSVPCTLTLLKHSVRHGASTPGNYARDIEHDDPRFIDSYGAIQSIVTSGAQNDSGLFETNLRDERYLPFEGAGVISTWKLELPAAFPAFDYGTISDVVLHVRYTARNGGDSLKQKASGELLTAINTIKAMANETGMARLFSLSHEFSNEWSRFVHAADANGDHLQMLRLSKDRFPYLFRNSTIKITKIEVYGVPKDARNPNSMVALELDDPNAQPIVFADGFALGSVLRAHSADDLDVEVRKPTNEQDLAADWTLRVNANGAALLNDLDDVILVCQYQVN